MLLSPSPLLCPSLLSSIDHIPNDVGGRAELRNLLLHRVAQIRLSVRLRLSHHSHLFLVFRESWEEAVEKGFEGSFDGCFAGLTSCCSDTTASLTGRSSLSAKLPACCNSPTTAKEKVQEE